MKIIHMIIGIAMVLTLCVTPVATVSGADFDIVIDESGKIPTYKYLNPNYKVHPNCPNSPREKYFKIHTKGTFFNYSLVTFKPAKFPDAPVMMVDTSGNYITSPPVDIYLPYHSVDEWEIKFYSRYLLTCYPEDEYLKNYSVVYLKEYFKKYISKGLVLELSQSQEIHPVGVSDFSYELHEV